MSSFSSWATEPSDIWPSPARRRPILLLDRWKMKKRRSPSRLTEPIDLIFIFIFFVLTLVFIFIFIFIFFVLTLVSPVAGHGSPAHVHFCATACAFLLPVCLNVATICPHVIPTARQWCLRPPTPPIWPGYCKGLITWLPPKLPPLLPPLRLPPPLWLLPRLLPPLPLWWQARPCIPTSPTTALQIPVGLWGSVGTVPLPAKWRRLAPRPTPAGLRWRNTALPLWPAPAPARCPCPRVAGSATICRNGLLHKNGLCLWLLPRAKPAPGLPYGAGHPATLNPYRPLPCPAPPTAPPLPLPLALATAPALHSARRRPAPALRWPRWPWRCPWLPCCCYGPIW